MSVTGYSIFNKYKRLKKQTPTWHTCYDFMFTGVEFDRSMTNFTKLLVQYAVYLNKDTDCVVNGFYSDNDQDSPAMTVFKIRNKEDIENAAERLFEYFNSRIRIFLRILAPVENTFKVVKIHFNMHHRPAEEAKVSTLLPLTTIHDITKVFFTIPEFATWDQILKSQPEFSPTEHLLDEYKNAYLNFRLVDALKCRILLQILDENIDNINHYMRILYSPSETMYNLAESMSILHELVRDFAQNEQSRLAYKKFTLEAIKEYSELINSEVEVAMLDSHNILCEGNQVKILNHVWEISQFLNDAEKKEFPENIEILELVMKKTKQIEIDLKVMSNLAILYISHYLKNVHKINLFDNPLIIE